MVVGVWVGGASERLGDRRPEWFEAFAEHLLERCAPAICLRHLRRVEAALGSGQVRCAALVAAVRDGGRSGRSPGATARYLEAFLVQRGLVLATDERGRLAAGRRARRVERCPEPFREALERHLAEMLEINRGAARRGQRALADNTIEQHLDVVADFAGHLHSHGLSDWALVDRARVESFLALAPRNMGSRLAALRSFFRFARRRRLVLSDPTAGLRHRSAPGFGGRTLSPAEQARLLRRFAGEEPHPNEALVGLLALLHGASGEELRVVKVADVDRAAATIRLGRRRHPVALDPLSAAAVARCMRHRKSLGTQNPHLIVTRCTRGHRTPASAPYLSHVLDPAGTTPRLLRQTRLADFAHRLDPRLVADAFGITAEAALR